MNGKNAGNEYTSSGGISALTEVYNSLRALDNCKSFRISPTRSRQKGLVLLDLPDILLMICHHLRQSFFLIGAELCFCRMTFSFLLFHVGLCVLMIATGGYCGYEMLSGDLL